MNSKQQRPSSEQFTFENLKDSVFINVAESVNDVSRKLSAPVRRGARANNTTTLALNETLESDMAKLIVSPLSQLWIAHSVPEMSSAQVEALRKLYTSIKNGSNSGWEIALENAIQLMQPSNITKDAVEFTNDEATKNQCGPSMLLRRSDRLAGLPNIYTTDLLNEAVLGMSTREKMTRKKMTKKRMIRKDILRKKKRMMIAKDNEKGYIKEVNDKEMDDKEVDDKEVDDEEIDDEEVDNEEMDDEEMDEEVDDKEVDDEEMDDEEVNDKEMDNEEVDYEEMDDEEMDDKVVDDKEMDHEEVDDEEVAAEKGYDKEKNDEGSDEMPSWIRMPSWMRGWTMS